MIRCSSINAIRHVYIHVHVCTCCFNIVDSCASIQYKDMLQLMLEASEEEGDEAQAKTSTANKKLSNEQIVAHSIGFLAAGYETTGNTLTYTAYLLALNPEVQERLQKEIDSYFEQQPVSEISLELSV